MPMWDRDPGKFDPIFHNALKDCPRPCTLGTFSTYDKAWHVRQHFYAFRYSLRQHPAHPLHSTEMNWNARTKIKEIGEGVWVLRLDFFNLGSARRAFHDAAN